MDQVVAIVEIAREEIGYCEKNNANNLYDKTAGAGSGNYTKYWVWWKEYSGSNLQGSPWCAAFVSWCANQAGVDDISFVYGVYCPTMVNQYKARGEWYTSNPKVGDVAFYASGGVASHVGLVVEVSGNTMKVIEGNTSSTEVFQNEGGCVALKTYNWKTSSYVLGFGRPTYSLEPDTNGCPYGSSTPLLKQGSTGLGVYRFQWYANEFGEDTGGLDGQYGAKSVQACKNIQSRYGLLVDGECGPNTWTAMIDNYQTDVKGELTVSQATEILAKLDDIQSRLVTLEATNLKVYNTLDEVKVLGNDFYVAAKYFVDNGLLKGIDASALGLSYEDCRMLVWMYRAKA